MDEELIINQISLILMQLRFTRRALEDIERNTARYSGVSFANALVAGTRFGEPPLFNGALKVHVVNLSDLNPGTGLGGLIQGILGGIGGFLGNFMGGIPGGFLAGITLPYLLAKMATITGHLNNILEHINIIRGPGGERAASSGGSGIDLNRWIRTMETLTNLFNAASGQGGGEGQQSPIPEETLVTLYVTQRLVESIGYLVNGLILMIPILVGSLAYLITRLDDLKFKLLDLLQFALRNTFLLRGVALVTIYDTLAGVARLAANLMRDISTTITSILSSLFTVIGAVLNTTLDTLRFIGSGLRRTMNGLLEWLRTGLGTFLIDVGRTDVFRLLHHLVRTLPLILPALVMLVRGRELSDTDRNALARAAQMRLPPGRLVGGMPAFTPFPDLGELMAPETETEALRHSVETARDAIMTGMNNSFNQARRGLQTIERDVQAASTSAVGLFADPNDPRLQALRRQAGQLAEALQPAVDAARAQPETGLEAIANAYERWLTGGGFQAVLNQLEAHFRRTPTATPDSQRALLGRIVAASAGVSEPPAATIRIDRVEIQVAPPEGQTISEIQMLDIEEHILAPAFVERLHNELDSHERELILRGA